MTTTPPTDDTTPPTDETTPPTHESMPVDIDNTVQEPQPTDDVHGNTHQQDVPEPTEIETTPQRIEIKVDEISTQLTGIKAYERYMDRKQTWSPTRRTRRARNQRQTTDAATADSTIKGTKPQHVKDSEPSKQSSSQEQRPSKRAAVPSKNCAFCNGSHYSTACRTYSTLTQREERVRALHKCIRCLKDTTHIATACR